MQVRGLSMAAATVLVALLLLTPAAALAQDSDEKLSDIIVNQYFDAAVNEVIVLQAVFPTVPFSVLATGLERQFEGAFTLNDMIGAQVSAFPLGSSAGGFAWTFDPALGTYERGSSTFGPIFSERALTVGRGQFNFGVNYQQATFDKVQDRQLREGEVTTYTGFTAAEIAAIGSIGPTAFFEDRLYLDLRTDTVGLFATYGVLDRLDVGIAVPIIHVEMETRLDTRAAVNNNFSNVITGDTVTGSATGVGDIVLRAKYNFWQARGGGLAAGLDWRLPTGDELDLLGVAGAQAKFYVAASSAAGPVSPHFNLGYIVSGSSEAAASLDTNVFAPADEFNYAGGVDVALTPRLTIVGDIVGRTLLDTFKLDFGPTKFGSAFESFAVSSGNVNLVLGSAGVKFNPLGTGLVAFNLLFPLNNNGLTDTLSWMAGAEFSF